ncbi:pantoate--beta-alanine ligase [Xanthocytophaga agilis]|uniref:Pantothenate synthetase n=1 Tax=Xanthocytophaga agilis TaxID=3048010 RepID=A0AAE3RDV7_9BACT|nr:pantoate--beta-alanine ligase [Xanthocytophaga agilis]MDJ1506212.1 pantoate--beta-alanine ligase [Xanthocytophaga agilis]
MQVFTSIHSLRDYLFQNRQQNKTIGFVPTMGALHEGHLSLIKRCKEDNDLAVCSIYVNPTQFNNPEDLKKYPRTPEADQQLLQDAGCDVLFMPADTEMYPAPVNLKMDFGNLETVLEGKFRPGHFNGVGIVVSKLFHMVQPDAAYFGQKDLQQCLVIRRLIQDLSFPVRLLICPTMRESDGLAMSSRNRRLSSAQRTVAPLLYQALEMAHAMLDNDGTIELAKKTVALHLTKSDEVELEYFEVVNTDDLSSFIEGKVQAPYALCIAAFVGGVRLIDNILVE